MGVYHRASLNTSENTFIILNPSKQFQSRLIERGKNSQGLPLSQLDIQILLLSSVTPNWAQYTGYLEQKFNILVGFKTLRPSIDLPRGRNSRPSFLLIVEMLLALKNGTPKLRLQMRKIFKFFAKSFVNLIMFWT